MTDVLSGNVTIGQSTIFLEKTDTFNFRIKYTNTYNGIK
jgi:hypothetical protein